MGHTRGKTHIFQRFDFWKKGSFTDLPDENPNLFDEYFNELEDWEAILSEEAEFPLKDQEPATPIHKQAK